MTGNRNGRRLSLATKRELIQVIAERYHAAARQDKKKILDEFIEVTGFHRKHVIRALRRTTREEEQPKDISPRTRIYDESVAHALTILWEAADRICGKRLKEAIPTLLDAMERHGHLQLDAGVRRMVLAASASTIDRLLAPIRGIGKQGQRTRISTPLRKSIAVRTFADWNDPPPGFFEMDMVAHCGKSVAGSYVHSLALTDIASAWTVASALVVREQTLITVSVEDIRNRLPFPMLGLDVDNDSAFLNDTLVGYCKERGITLTRSRAYKKNDQAWIEQKNGSVVRRMIGYGRLEGVRAAASVAELHDAAQFYVNFFLPSFKLQTKKRDGAKVTKKYDKPATPYERLLASKQVTDEQKRQLRETFATLDPISLLRRIREVQNTIAKLEISGAAAEPAAAGQSIDGFVRSLGTVWKDGEIRSTHRKQVAAPRTWRTRADPFESIWPTIVQWLNEQPDATAKEIFQRLRASVVEPFQPSQLRTLQRRIKEWRTAIARRLVLGVEMEPEPAATGGLP